ncbi:MAG: SDR family oxidoreductase [Legionella sp.]|nr:MAG: SDR family oxidoreductase [Legionella sp.]
MKILILGVSGMLGNAVFRSFLEDADYDVWGTVRSPHWLAHFSATSQSKLITGVDIFNQDLLLNVLESTRPDLVINLIGVTKQQPGGNDPSIVIPINALFPHRLAKLCKLIECRLIQKSTDCVFSGKKGLYTELDETDATDLYGRSKFMGEILDYPNVVTIRTSAIGHELNSNYGLVDWFLSQDKSTNGYVNAIFSGLPAFELGRVIRDYIAPNKDLKGLYHVSSTPINKYELLMKIADVYKKKIIINPDKELVIDRSLDSSKFLHATGYIPPNWDDLLAMMYKSSKFSGAH